MNAPASDSFAYDYIVVGAGSAGCITAARLAREQAGNVLLLEAGPPAEQNPETLSADGFKYAFANDAVMMHRMTAQQDACGGRRLFAGTGRGMGGSGGVNGMVYTRGNKRDFDNWPQGWQWHDLTPAFEAVEQALGIQPRPPTDFVKRFIRSAEAVGMRRKDGMNDGDLGGVVGCNDMNYSGSERRSSCRAFIHGHCPDNLEIKAQAQVLRLIFDDHHSAVAVEYRHQGESRRAAINREVILCAGALETPKLLMLSGIGPRAELEKHGIDVVLDAPNVGEHLQDHPNVCLLYRAKVPIDFEHPQVYAFDAARRTGDETTNPAPDSCFVCYAAPASIKHSMLRMLPVLALPGRLHHVRPLRSLLRGLIHLAFALPSLKRFVSGVFGIVVILGKPQSQGSVRLASSNPREPALVDPAYYSSQDDRDTMEAAIHKARRIASQAPLAEAGTRPLSAGAKQSTGKALWKWIHAATMTTFHFCSSCRMGEDDASPVDTRLRVKGLQNVRVADASVIPGIPVSALNASSMMIGYRAADFILAARSGQTNKRDAA